MLDIAQEAFSYIIASIWRRCPLSLSCRGEETKTSPEMYLKSSTLIFKQRRGRPSRELVRLPSIWERHVNLNNRTQATQSQEDEIRYSVLGTEYNRLSHNPFTYSQAGIPFLTVTQPSSLRKPQRPSCNYRLWSAPRRTPLLLTP